MADTEALFAILRQSCEDEAAAAIEQLVKSGEDLQLNRINVFDFAARSGAGVEHCIAAFLRASRLGLFDMSWNVLCPGCGGVLEAGAGLKDMHHARYDCALCSAGYEPTLDEMVEVTFTVNSRVRRIAAHDPDALPFADYMRQVFWGTGIDLPPDWSQRLQDDVVIEAVELPAGEKALLSLQLPAAFVILIDPVTHSTQFIDVKGEPARERQHLAMVFNKVQAATGTLEMRPGPLRLTLENQTGRRVLPALFIAGDALHHLLGARKPFLTAKRVLTNQVFRDLYRADTLALDQRLKITSLTFLFTDLEASTELYDRVGDLAAYELVQGHFKVLAAIVAAETGAVVKTIGDAVMATFATPDRALAAALRMRAAVAELNAGAARGLRLKIGIHEGPCLAVTLNDRQDYFGQTVNIASRVQGLADSRAILATGPVVDNAQTAEVLRHAGLAPERQMRQLRGISGDLMLYSIP